MNHTRMDAHILYQDEDIIAAVKPYGALSEAHPSLPNMPAILREQCGCEVFPVHRLDKTTEGLMVYAKTKGAAAELSAAIQRGALEKTYLAVVEGLPDESGEMTDLLYFDRSRGKSYVVSRARKGVKEARLRYERIGTSQIGEKTASAVKIRLLTGRTHQIRVQFASRGMPLVGDRRYGSRIPAERIALCAAELIFPHPITGDMLRFSCTPSFPIAQNKWLSHKKIMSF